MLLSWFCAGWRFALCQGSKSYHGGYSSSCVDLGLSIREDPPEDPGTELTESKVLGVTSLRAAGWRHRSFKI